MITKRLVVVNGMTGQEMPIRVGQGATPANILSQLGFQESGKHKLARVGNRHIFQPNCDVSRVVRDGERLFAFESMEVGVSS